MGWLIALIILTGLAILPLGVSALYDADGAVVRVIAGPVRIKVFPLKKKKKSQPKEEQSKKDVTSAKPPKETPSASEAPEKTLRSLLPPLPEEKKKLSFGDIEKFLPLVRVALDFLGDFRRKLRVNRLDVKVILAGDDPCDLATNYGRAWTALGNLWPRLERLFVIRKRDVQVECDFTGDKTLIYARLDLTITLGRILGLAVRYGIRGLKEFKKKKKTM